MSAYTTGKIPNVHLIKTENYPTNGILVIHWFSTQWYLNEPSK